MMAWAAQGYADVSDAKTSSPQFAWRDWLDIFNCFTEHSSFQTRKVEVRGQSRADALTIAGRVTSAAYGPGSSHAFAVPQDGLLRAETDNRHLRRLVGLLLLTVIFILHENKALHRTTKCLVKCSAPAAARARRRVVQHWE